MHLQTVGILVQRCRITAGPAETGIGGRSVDPASRRRWREAAGGCEVELT